jgi:hypothetical protein
MALVPGSAGADGAVAIGLTASFEQDGLAVGYAWNYKTADEARSVAMARCREYAAAPLAAQQCRLVVTLQSECFALAMDPEPGTPGLGWATGRDKATAENRALDACAVRSGPDRRETCKVDTALCDGGE